MGKIIFTGDFYPAGRLTEAVAGNDWSAVYNDLLSVLQKSDLNITNLESPFYDGQSPILKNGPSLKASPGLVKALVSGHFDLVTLANNHIMDHGENGLESTLNICADNGVESIGAGRSLAEARRPFFKVIGNTRIGFLNFCENESSTTNGENPGANPLDPIGNFYDIQETKRDCDILFVIIHGGSEYYPLPTPRMQKTYRFFIDAGADAIIGHHIHTYSGYELYKGKHILYSLGNFIFDKPGKEKSWHEGFMAEFEFTDGPLSLKTHPYIQFGKDPGVRLMNISEQADFEKNITLLNRTIGDPKLLKYEYDEFVKTREKAYIHSLEPYTGIMSSLRWRKWLPSLLSDKKKTAILNTIRCEAHRDLIIEALTRNLKK